MISLADLNSLPRPDAVREFLKCCGAKDWAEGMAAGRPFADRGALFREAARLWDALGTDAWQEAFDHHPRIGGTDELRKKFGQTREWASEEQGGVAGSGADVIAALAEGNRRYEARYGHIFLVCATGKSASEMLAILESRMNHTPEAELKIAAGEQAKITQIRLEKLIS